METPSPRASPHFFVGQGIIKKSLGPHGCISSRFSPQHRGSVDHHGPSTHGPILDTLHCGLAGWYLSAMCLSMSIMSI